MAEGRYTSAFSEMGVRVHRRLMAMADVALAVKFDLKTGAVLSPANAITREEEFDTWLTTNFDGPNVTRIAPAYNELSYFFVAGSDQQVVLNPLNTENPDALVIPETQAAVRNYAPCREAPVIDNIHWSHSDCWIVHHFAYNAWTTVCAWASQAEVASMSVLETEVAVIWPFGLHTGKAGAIGSRAACGKPFETRIDLVCQFNTPADNTMNKLVIIEFKTKMERKNPYGEDKAYLLNKGTDCRQPVLNAWLYYFKTLRLPSKCLLLYATRRDQVPLSNTADGNDSAVVGEIDFEQAVKQPWCVQLISTFARGAYGGFSNGRYADSRILVPDLRRLMTWSVGRSGTRSKKTNRKSKRPAKPQPPKETDFDPDGYLHVFRQMLPGSRFQCLVECAKDGTAAAGDENVRNRLNAPSEIRIPKGARVPTGIRMDGISRLNTSNDLTRLVSEWRSEPEDDREKAKYGSAYLAYDDNDVQWLPIVLDELGRPLVLCNAKVPADKFVFRFGQPLSGQVVGAQAILPAGGGNILRRSALLSLHNRLSMPRSMANHPLTIRRRELNGAVTAATERVMRKLRRYFTRGRVEPTVFWEMTTEEIYRINLAPGGPRIREFAERHDDCAVPPDPNTPSHNYECVERCINRLLNTRLMRAMLALGGQSDFTDDHVDHAADGISWTPGLLQDFRTKELEAVAGGLRESTNTTGQTRDPPEWWNSQGPRFANDNRTRLDRFPHMSQRVMWSATAFDCLLAPVGGRDGSETMVDLVAENVENCLENALAREN